ncbi:hypothetical protein POM88_009785 [Heracleum sosnowskyi]|uniref:Uncharacterized protein n=1 Tax=Heracleum sosnowskyi TaxID=360622 RepID=A0AAD8J8Y8_9APIA|nr:hypothetical protein POM88_009785 [Heracleum sosnowskyi]
MLIPLGRFCCMTRRDLVNWCGSDISGFVDGAWMMQHDSTCMAGIGGILVESAKYIVYILSGPSNAKSVYQSQLEAAIFLIKAMWNSPWRNAKCTIHVDNEELLVNLQKAKILRTRMDEADEHFTDMLLVLNLASVVKLPGNISGLQLPQDPASSNQNRLDSHSSSHIASEIGTLLNRLYSP